MTDDQALSAKILCSILHSKYSFIKLQLTLLARLLKFIHLLNNLSSSLAFWTRFIIWVPNSML